MEAHKTSTMIANYYKGIYKGSPCLIVDGEDRMSVMNYLRKNNLLDHVPVWKLAQALFEVMPRDEED